jgi:hypothetical protein
MTAETKSLDHSDALQKVGPIAAFIEFIKTPNLGVGWRLSRITPEAPDLFNPEGDRVSVELELWVHRDEGEGYYLNLESPEPSIFVKWRLKESSYEGGVQKVGKPEAIAISLSYNEAGRWLDAGEPVDRVLMPAEMLPWLAEFTQLHYEPEGKKKKRGPKPSFMSRTEFSEMAMREANIHRKAE